MGEQDLLPLRDCAHSSVRLMYKSTSEIHHPLLFVQEKKSFCHLKSIHLKQSIKQVVFCSFIMNQLSRTKGGKKEVRAHWREFKWTDCVCVRACATF